jgi:hypothetical protein
MHDGEVKLTDGVGFGTGTLDDTGCSLACWHAAECFHQ